MIYLALYQLREHYPALNVLRYETFRSVLAGLAALAISMALSPLLIRRFRAAHIGQTIRDEVPQSHQKKAGTPTMGGLVILVSCIVATLLLANPGESLCLAGDFRDGGVWRDWFQRRLSETAARARQWAERAAKVAVAVRYGIRGGGGAVRLAEIRHATDVSIF